MKSFIIFISAILVVSALSDGEQWQQFKLKHNKVYKSVVEEKRRFAIFQENLRTIETHNAKYDRKEVSYFMGVNQFTDLTDAEFKQIYLSDVLPRQSKALGIFKGATNVSDVPEAIDWQEKGAVLPVKDQGTCASGWSFSAAGAVEGQNAIHHNLKVAISEQELIDCSGQLGNRGCAGGEMTLAYDYIEANGISTEDSYKFTGVDGQCHRGRDSNTKVLGYMEVARSEEALKHAVGTEGPVSVAIHADELKSYAGGIYDNLLCFDRALNHEVITIGYGHEGKDYWIVKNSWGEHWGEKGYFRLVRNVRNNCGIHHRGTYPSVV